MGMYGYPLNDDGLWWTPNWMTICWNCPIFAQFLRSPEPVLSTKSTPDILTAFNMTREPLQLNDLRWPEFLSFCGGIYWVEWCIPGSSKCVKVGPFHPKNLQGRNSTYLEEPYQKKQQPAPTKKTTNRPKKWFCGMFHPVEVIQALQKPLPSLKLT